MTKIFCGGITPTTTDEMLFEAFSQFGTVVEAQVMRERETLKSRGFGFVTFADPESVDSVLANGIELEGRVIDCKSAQSREELSGFPMPRQGSNVRHRQHPPQRGFGGFGGGNYGGRNFGGKNFSGGNYGGNYGGPPRRQPRNHMSQAQTGGPIVSGKVFIGGLSPSTTQESLLAATQCFGDVAEVMVMFDKITSKSRGFGFVTFTDTSSVNLVLQTPDFEVDGKVVECKPAQAKLDDHVEAPVSTRQSRDFGRGARDYEGDSMQPHHQRSANLPSKIFVGGLATTTDEQALRTYFSQYGAITDAMIMIDKATNNSRGFGFVTFSSASEMHMCLADRDNHHLDGKWVDCKQSVPEDQIGGKGPPRGNMGGKGMQRGGFGKGGKGQKMGFQPRMGGRRGPY